MTTKPTTGVGYKKPPLHSRFKKGQSGNPRGRPRGSKNFSTLRAVGCHKLNTPRSSPPADGSRCAAAENRAYPAQRWCPPVPEVCSLPPASRQIVPRKIVLDARESVFLQDAPHRGRRAASGRRVGFRHLLSPAPRNGNGDSSASAQPHYSSRERRAYASLESWPRSSRARLPEATAKGACLRT